MRCQEIFLSFLEPSTSESDPRSMKPSGKPNRRRMPVPRSCDFFLSQGRESTTLGPALCFVELAFLFLVRPMGISLCRNCKGRHEFNVCRAATQCLVRLPHAAQFFDYAVYDSWPVAGCGLPQKAGGGVPGGG